MNTTKPYNTRSSLQTSPSSPTMDVPLASTVQSISIPSTTIASTISNFQLPVPTYTPVDHNKKSHARKQPAGHVPRPRNAFILFRGNVVEQKRIPVSVEKDHRNISRIVGGIWNGLSDEERNPWVRMAEEEKSAHLRKHPGYRFSRASGPRTKTAKRGNGANNTNVHEYAPHIPPVTDAALLSALTAGKGMDRAASCPPGAIHIPSVNVEFGNAFRNAEFTRDDLARRPSRVMLYQSTHYDDLHAVENLATTTSGACNAQDVHRSHWSDGVRLYHQEDVRFTGPRINALHAPIPGIDDYDWDNSAQETPSWDEYDAEEQGSLLMPVIKEPTDDGFEYPSHGLPQPSYDFNLSQTLPPVPLHKSPETHYADYSLGARSPIERKNSFISPKSGKWKLPPLETLYPNSGPAASSSKIDSLVTSSIDNLGHDELRYPDDSESDRHVYAPYPTWPDARSHKDASAQGSSRGSAPQ